MHTRSLIATGMVCATVVAVAGFLSNAGPLSPPAGPVAPTPGPEPRIAINASNTPGDADSLFKITQPGSYYLTGNITGVANKHGIEIAANGVTLDLNGFELRGVAGSLDGIFVGSVRNVQLVNGSIRDWGDDGVDAFTATNSSLRDLVAADNGGAGLIIGRTGSLTGAGSTVTRCAAIANGTFGILAGFGSTVRGCLAQSNVNDGIIAASGSTVMACTALLNGVDGISAANSTVSGCTARSNGDDGIDASSAAVNASTAMFNGDDGIFGGEGATISNANASFNSGDGIEVLRDALVLNNVCHSNGISGDGAGIHATQSDNRIEGNNVTDSDRGVDVDAAGNFIVRNSASGNTTNYDIVSGNTVGAIFDFTGGGNVTSSVINGFGAWAGPWANFSY